MCAYPNASDAELAACRVHIDLSVHPCALRLATFIGAGLTVAHSWDTSLFSEWGVAMGKEFQGKGANVQFGPAVNVARIANGGRSFEYLSGEDPFLG